MEAIEMSNNRYFAQIVDIIDNLNVVMNAGENRGVKIGNQFLIVGIGKEIFDPDTEESLGFVEIIKGNVKVVHVQEKMATLQSTDLIKRPDVREITKVSKLHEGRDALTRILGNLSPSQTTTEIIKPQEANLKPLNNVKIGDKIILIK
ncbi:hypothetical protein GCWU000324_00003 [Kingella oralis ATCC 51147]|jgi:hypothetical protein|uniref:Uncharacterized protein n=2 Tax=Kingella TaxID=32257 RepID=C4GEC1_9NEIS|nr:hypothetical protein GCWU000324_00003 [Kingella oralis ATCC 51147]